MLPLTTYKLYIKQLEDENYRESRKFIEFTTTRSVSDVEQKIDALSNDFSFDELAKLNEIASLIAEVSQNDIQLIESKVQLYNSKVEDYNRAVRSFNNLASEAKSVANNIVDGVIEVIVLTVTLLAVKTCFTVTLLV